MEPILATTPHCRFSLTPFGVYFHLTRFLQRRFYLVAFFVVDLTNGAGPEGIGFRGLVALITGTSTFAVLGFTLAMYLLSAFIVFGSSLRSTDLVEGRGAATLTVRFIASGGATTTGFGAAASAVTAAI
jgi:hypothetical protein